MSASWPDRVDRSSWLIRAPVQVHVPGVNSIPMVCVNLDKFPRLRSRASPRPESLWWDVPAATPAALTQPPSHGAAHPCPVRHIPRKSRGGVFIPGRASVATLLRP